MSYQTIDETYFQNPSYTGSGNNSHPLLANNTSRRGRKSHQKKAYRTELPAPVDYRISDGVGSSWADVDLIRNHPALRNKYGKKAGSTPCPKSFFRKYPYPKTLEGKFFVPLGQGPIPLDYETRFAKLPKDSMFLFAKNVSSPACCPSTFSDSRGCVCVTPDQEKYVAQMRGANNTFYHGEFY